MRDAGAYRWVPGTGNSIRWFFSGVWLAYLIVPVSRLFPHRVHGHLVRHSALWIAGGLAIAVTFCAVYIYLLGSRPGTRRPARSCLAILALLAVLACVVYGQVWLSLWIYVSAAVGFAISGIPAMLTVAGIVGCYSFLSWLAHSSMSNFLATLLPVALIGLAMIGFRMQVALMQQLGQARETVAKLAASEERLRVTRDMHDLTGQSLAIITLKSDLARKILSRLLVSAEHSAAMREMEDIGRVSRQTLHDIREALSGYRRPTLAIEIITARTAFEAAGIALDDGPELTVRSGSFDPEAEAVLAWCLREAVTNVIRHSGARNCRIRLRQCDGELSLEVTDDGRGLQGTQGPAGSLHSTQGTAGGTGLPAAQGPASGTGWPGNQGTAGAGLHGMSERLSAVGGRLSLGTADHGRGLQLVAAVQPGVFGDPGQSAATRGKER